MHPRLIGVLFLILMAILALSWCLADGALATDPSPSPSPSPTVTPAPEPVASPALVKRALRVRDRAKAQRKQLTRVRACFKARGPVRMYQKPKTRLQAA